MAAPLVLTNHGVFNLSGGELKSELDTITLIGLVGSGAAVHFISLGDGQVQLLEVQPS